MDQGTDCLFSGLVPLTLKTGSSSSTKTNSSTLPPFSSLSTNSTTGLVHTDGHTVNLFSSNAGTGGLAGLGSTTGDSLSSGVPVYRQLNTEVFYNASRKLLELRLSDTSDPFFTLQAVIGEDDFYALRRDQNLVIDFGRFPFKLVELLQRCQLSANGGDSSSNSTGQFYAYLIVPSTEEKAPRQLAITEVNSLRQITHLTLKLAPLPDSLIKRQLTETLRIYKGEIETLRIQLQESQRASLAQTIRPSGQVPPSSASSSSAQQASGSAYWEEKCAALEQTKTRLEAELQAERRRYVSGGSNFPSGSSSLLPGAASDLLRDRDSSITRLQELLQATRENKTQLEASIDTLRQKITTLESQVATKSTDLIKSNDIIRKLQEELKISKQRLRNATHLGTQQEQIIKVSEENVHKLRTELEESKKDLDSCKAEIALLQQDKKRFSLEVSELKSSKANLERINTYLHTQINERAERRVAAAVSNSGQSGNATTITNTAGSNTGRLSPETMRGKEPATVSNDVF